MSATQEPPVAYEPHDASPRWILITGVALAAAVAITLAVAGWIYASVYSRRPTAPSLATQGSFAHGAEAQTDIDAAWTELDAGVQRHLHTYEWIDREAGIVRIPIERAMEIVAAGKSPEAQTGKAGGSSP